MKNWKLLSTERFYHSSYMSVFNDRVMLPNGQVITYARVELKDFVSILPFINNDEIVMIENVHHPAKP